MDKVIIHTATRVIVGVTSDGGYQIQPGFSLVPWKGSEKFLVEVGTKLGPDDAGVDLATEQEINSMLDAREPKRAARREFLAAIDDLLADTALPAKIKNVFQALKGMFI